MLKVYHKVAHGTMQAGDMGARAIGSQCETGYRRRRDHSRHLGSRIALTGQFIDGDDALACASHSSHFAPQTRTRREPNHLVRLMPVQGQTPNLYYFLVEGSATTSLPSFLEIACFVNCSCWTARTCFPPLT